MIFLLVAGKDTVAQEYVYTDATVKAAYILNLSGFIDFPNTKEQLDICIIGDDLIGISLANLQSQKLPKSQNIIISKREVNSSYDSCELLYISAQRADQLSYILYKTESLPVLTISDISSFAQKGGMVELVNSGKKVLLHINLIEIKRKNLKISGKVLEIAEEVYR